MRSTKVSANVPWLQARGKVRERKFSTKIKHLSKNKYQFSNKIAMACNHCYKAVLLSVIIFIIRVYYVLDIF